MTDNLPALRDYCVDMAQGDLLPRQYRDKPANVMYAVEYADALGIPRINALTSIHVIDGKPTASADLIGSLVRKAGHKMRVEGDDTYAEVTIIRADDPDYVPNPVRWDEAKARKAGKWGSKGPWTNYPAAMLRSRAITEAARMWASDALYGVICTAEELNAQTDAEGVPVSVESERVSQPRQQQRSAPAQSQPAPAPTETADGLLAEAEQAEGDRDALLALFHRTSGLPAEDVAMVRDTITALGKASQEQPAPSSDEATETVQEVMDAELVEDAA